MRQTTSERWAHQDHQRMLNQGGLHDANGVMEMREPRIDEDDLEGNELAVLVLRRANELHGPARQDGLSRLERLMGAIEDLEDYIDAHGEPADTEAPDPEDGWDDDTRWTHGRW